MTDKLLELDVTDELLELDVTDELLLELDLLDHEELLRLLAELELDELDRSSMWRICNRTSSHSLGPGN